LQGCSVVWADAVQQKYVLWPAVICVFDFVQPGQDVVRGYVHYFTEFYQQLYGYAVSAIFRMLDMVCADIGFFGEFFTGEAMFPAQVPQVFAECVFSHWITSLRFEIDLLAFGGYFQKNYHNNNSIC